MPDPMPLWEFHVRHVAAGRIRCDDQASVQMFVEEFDRLRAELAYEISRRTVGGAECPVDKTWANRGLGTPEAGAEGAVHRRVGMARSDDKNGPPSPK